MDSANRSVLINIKRQFMMDKVNAQSAPYLSRLLELQLEETPNQEKFLTRRFADLSSIEIREIEELAKNVCKLIEGDELRHVQDYDWICNLMLEEELHFRRRGKYRLSTFAEAYEEVYSQKEYMKHYMNGLLMTQLWWSNHSQSMDFYRTHFLAKNKPNYSHLEIGPGHGLLLYLAANDPKAGSVRGWEVSKASAEMTTEALTRLDVPRVPEMELKDFIKGATGQFDSVVFSEVLEHLEDPKDALIKLRTLLSSNGRIFINMPINSPAPDHLFTTDTPEDLEQLIIESGFSVSDRGFFPATNQTLESARKKKMTISCAFVATATNE